MKQAGGRFVDCLILGAGWAGGNVFLDVLGKSGPPGEPLNEGDSVMNARVTGEFAPVGPLQHS